MGRRSFISVSAINSLISSINRRQREKEKEALIAANSGKCKELPPEYSLKDVEFDESTRFAKILFRQTQQYRTIERYVTQNYVKYPIYSSWKTKEKIIKKTIKLTNNVLEKLNENDDILISEFAAKIILSINDESLFPSWFLRECLEQEYQEKSSLLCKEFENFSSEQTSKIKQLQSNILTNQEKILIQDKSLLKIKKDKDSIEKKLRKLRKLESSKNSIFLSIITLGIRNALLSKKRRKRIELKLEFIQSNLFKTEECIKSIQCAIHDYEKHINEIEKIISDRHKDYMKSLRSELKIMNEEVNKITPLPTEMSEDESFVPLKLLLGYENKQFIGCYVIRNTQNNKYYVGQSKDVMKRIKQHFRGTTPNNIIFAEDYYFCPEDKRDSLFEIKIIHCETKDELDKTEKRLIEEYDSFNNGYNGTAGNK